MVRLSVTKNGGLTIFMVGMVAASISMMAIVIFACAKSSTKRKNKNNPYSGGDRNSTKNIVIGESNYKAEKTRATSAPVRSTGEILVSGAEIATTFVDIPSTDDGGKDTRCHDGGDTTKSNGGDDGSKINDISIDRNDNNYVSGDNNNNYIGASHTHASTSTSTGGGGGHHHNDTSGNTGGGGGWSNDHGGSSWGGGDHHGGGGFSGGGDTGGFSGGGW